MSLCHCFPYHAYFGAAGQKTDSMQSLYFIGRGSDQSLLVGVLNGVFP